jgi:demethylmenaquinone methyltransferase/2-methoxy-6-polyprenyl-1,4-benzoquinol methylase
MRPRRVPDSRCGYFDSIADQWHDLPDLARRLDDGLSRFGIRHDEVVLDIGCGTGNLTLALLRRLGGAGRVVAIDISEKMLELAKSKIRDPRAAWYHAGVDRLPCAAESADRVMCYSVWPHFNDAEAAAREFRRVLRPGGLLHVWHLISRDEVNRIHQNADEAVQEDRLPPAGETGCLLTGLGFTVEEETDDESRYLVTARKKKGAA